MLNFKYSDHISSEPTSAKIRDLESQVEFYKSSEARKERHLEGKLLILEAFQRQQAMNDVYQNVLGVIIDVTGYSAGCFHIFSPDLRHLLLAASNNIPSKYLPALEVHDFQSNNLQPFLQKKLVFGDDLENLLIHFPMIFTDGEIVSSSSVSIHLSTKNQIIGVLSLFNLTNQDRQIDAEPDWLLAIGRQLGILIGHLRASETLQNEAVIRERERLSRELHDNLSQSVSTIRLLSQRIAKKFETKELSDVKTDIDIIEKIAEDTYGVIREEMVGLRFVDEPNKDIVSLINDYLTDFERRWTISAQLQPHNFDDSTLIPPVITIQLFRIIQEALTNIRRHANATKIDISLEVRDDCLVTTLKDNGVGFDPQAIPENRFGIKIMLERAESLGGSLRIISTPRLGSLIEIIIPFVN